MSLSQYGQRKKKQAVRRLSSGSATKVWGRGGAKTRGDRRRPDHRAAQPPPPRPQQQDFRQGDATREPFGDTAQVKDFAKLSPRKIQFTEKDRGDDISKTQRLPRQTVTRRDPRSIPESYEVDYGTEDIASLETFGEASPKRTSKVGLFARALTDVTKGTTGRRTATEAEIPKPVIKDTGNNSQRSRGFLQEEDLRSKVSLRLREIPEQYNNKDYLHKFYSEFGRVKRIYPNPRKATAVVTYFDHESAARAKGNGKVLQPGNHNIQIYWSQSPTKRLSSEKNDGRDENIKAGVKVMIKPTNTDEKLSDKLTRVSRTQDKIPTSTATVVTSHTTKPAVTSTVSMVTTSKPTTTNIKNGQDLHHLIGKVAKTAHDKYMLLEERDKILRQNRKKTSDKSFKATVGTCPDMCNEKERYMRQDQRRLSSFEIIPGTDNKAAGYTDPQVDHVKAVKEYSRSSADQEAPLSHELRHASVLTLTMNYLLHHIMDHGEGRWADWYDFVWSRTRGIRKDITQQNLTDITAVGLIEKCARFHIYCSHRLCEEEMGVFSPKINNENLTKCLQSLEHFYYDLNNENIHCPNEAEFRTYDILLKLNEGDILRKIQLYRDEVRESQSVKQAIEAFYAVNSNNFVRFFKVVRKTTYMNACIMHRYFTQVRSRALRIMNRAYNVSSHPTVYPLSDLIRQLAFEDTREATDFCSKHGLTVGEDTVHFDRAAFIQPEDTITAARSLSIIETKNVTSVAEVVNGGALLPLQLHTPISSFDNFDRYVGDSSITLPALPPKNGAGDSIDKPVTTVPVPIPTPTNPPAPAPAPAPAPEPTPTPTMVYPNEVIKDIARDLFLEVINEHVMQISQTVVTMAQSFVAASNIAMETIIDDVSVSMVKEIAEDVITTETQKKEDERKAAEVAAELHASKQRALQEICQDLVEDVVIDECDDIASMQMREVRSTLKEESVSRCSGTLTDEIVTTCVDKECRHIAREVIREEENLRDEKLDDIERLVHLLITARFFKRWSNEFIGRQRLKRSMFTFPSAPLILTSQEQVDKLSPWQQSRARPTFNTSLPLTKRARLSTESPVSIESGRVWTSHRILLHNYITMMKEKQSWQPLNLPHLLVEELHHQPGYHSNKMPQQHFWKIVLSLPEYANGQDKDVTVEWIEAKLTRGKPTELENKKVKTLSLYSSQVDRIEDRHVSICTKSIQGMISASEKDHVLGTSGIILALPPIVNQHENDYWSCCRRRLGSLLYNKPSIPAVPLVILLLDWPPTSSIQYKCVQGLDLDTHKQHGLISVYSVVPISSDVLDSMTQQQFSDCISWLAKSSPSQPVLTASPLQDYMETGIVEYFITPLLQQTMQYKEYYQNHQDPNKYIALFNQVWKYLTSVITSDELTQLSWPIPEFTTLHSEPDLPRIGWNSKETQTSMRSVLLSCQLPSLPSLPDTENWSDVWQYVMTYIDRLPKAGQDKGALYSRVKWLMNRAYEEYQYSDLLAMTDYSEKSVWKYVPWNLIIEACVGFVMTSVTKLLPDDTTQRDIIWVYYYQDQLKRFHPPVLPLVTAHDLEQDREEHTIIEQQSTDRLPSTTEEAPSKAIPVKLRGQSPQLNQTISSIKDLEQKMLEEKTQADSYDQQLRRWLEEEPYIPAPNVHTSTTPIPRHVSHKESQRTECRDGSIEEKIQELEQQLNESRRAENLSEMTLNTWLYY